jgi:AraC-like DNA-binding protein
VLCYIAPSFGGPLAQLVEQLTLNQRVVGSSPTRPTIAGMTLQLRLSLTIPSLCALAPVAQRVHQQGKPPRTGVGWGNRGGKALPDLPAPAGRERKAPRGRQPVTRIAYEVGYEGEAAFIRAFKRKFGIPPATWRKQMQPTEM